MPLIGITGNLGARGCELAEGYWRQVVAAGGVPVVIPPYYHAEALEQTLRAIDGLVLSGGGDLGDLPERDRCELHLISCARQLQMPVLGICKGEQMLPIALGGTIHQDIAGWQGLPHSQTEPRHQTTHTVRLAGTLADVFRAESIEVNSFHHQAVSDAGPHLRPCAWAADGVVEGVESAEHKAILGVQWHPECIPHEPVFRWLIKEARTYRRAVRLHQRCLTLDSHCDTPMKFHTDEERLTTLPLMRDGRLDATVMVAYLPQDSDTEADPILDEIEQMVARHGDEAVLATTPAQILAAKAQGKRAIVPGIENGKAIGDDLGRVAHFRRRGVVYITLCHNGDNQICDSARGRATHGGISPFGRQVVAEMNRVGLMVDLSHAAESSFWQALDLSATPVVCSHSSCRALCDHPRNLTDQQMRALASRGGVMQVTLYHGFLRQDGKATVLDAVRHIRHAAEVMGIDHVGIGTDFDGDGGVPGCANAAELLNLTRLLIKDGFTDDDLAKLWGANFLRVMTQCQQT